MGLKVPSNPGHSGILCESLWFCPKALLAPETGGPTLPRKAASSVSLCLPVLGCHQQSTWQMLVVLCRQIQPGWRLREQGHQHGQGMNMCPCGAAPWTCGLPVLHGGTPTDSGCAAAAGTSYEDSECQANAPLTRGSAMWHSHAWVTQRVLGAARGAWGAVTPQPPAG